MNNFSSLVTGVGGIVLLIALVIWLIASRYRVARPNEAYIITGQKGKAVTNPETGLVSTDLSGQKVIMGGGVFVIPLIQRLHVLDLSSRRIMVQIRNAVSGQGIKLNLDGVAIVKVGGNEDSIRAAAQRFLMQQEEIETFTQETLAGALRSIVGGLSVEQIIRDRAAFAQRVADESEASLTGQGLVLDTFQIQDITDDGTYLSDLGRPESAKVGQIAAIAEANARREAEQARLAAEQEIAISERELVLKEAEIKAETDAARAQAAAAGPLAQADRDQAILTEQEKVAVRQAALKDRQLDTEVRKPADAKRYETETAAQGRRNSEIFEAEARKAAAIANAEAQAETARLTGEGEKQRRAALAELLGESEGRPDELVRRAHAEQRDVAAGAPGQRLAHGQGQELVVDRGAVGDPRVRAGDDRGPDALRERNAAASYADEDDPRRALVPLHDLVRNARECAADRIFIHQNRLVDQGRHIIPPLSVLRWHFVHQLSCLLHVFSRFSALAARHEGSLSYPRAFLPRMSCALSCADA